MNDRVAGNNVFAGPGAIFQDELVGNGEIL